MSDLNERLGHPADAKLVIISCDDLGSCHAANEGVYRALLQHRLEVLKQLGIPLATVHAISNTSAPILKKFGFEEVCKLYSYHDR